MTAAGACSEAGSMTADYMNFPARTSAASEPRARSEPAQRRARARVGESEGRRPSESMMAPVSEQPQRARVSAAGILSVIAGAALFAVVLWRAGPREVWQGIVGLGWWFAVIVAIGGLRFA